MHNDFPAEACLPGTTREEAEARANALTAEYLDQLKRQGHRPEGLGVRARHRVMSVRAFDPYIARGRANYDRTREHVRKLDPDATLHTWEELDQSARDNWIRTARDAGLNEWSGVPIWPHPTNGN